MKKFDKIIIVTLLLISLISIIVLKMPKENSQGEKYVVIYVNRELYKKISLMDNNLDKTFKIETEFGYNIVQIKNGGVNIIDADCPDKYCVTDGFIDQPGQMLVCLPHRLVIEIKGTSNNDELVPDEISY